MLTVFHRNTLAALWIISSASACLPYSRSTPALIEMPSYSAVVKEIGDLPTLSLQRDHETVFEIPVVSGLSSVAQEEQLTQVESSLRHLPDGTWELSAVARSSIWSQRRFVWHFYPDHIEFQQFASGHGRLRRNYFLSNGVSSRWGNGTLENRHWDITIYADRYFVPNPNHANQFEFNIAMPQTLGFTDGSKQGSEQDFRPETLTGLFAPPPQFLAFHLDHTWVGVGIGAQPGEYQFPALEYTGARFGGASLFVDYMGYREVDGDFASPILCFNFAYAPLDTLANYTKWLDARGFSTESHTPDIPWHHLPIFCGWSEQVSQSVVLGQPPNTMATQKNYEKWISILEKREIPVGTVIIDDKWQKAYGTFEVDTQKWPDLRGFVAAQHARGRHVLLWVPVAHPEGLANSFCVMSDGKCIAADVGNPEYELYLRSKIHHLMVDYGVDGFKEDWVNVPVATGLSSYNSTFGIEFARRFQWILYSETHKWKPDAMIETQTVNAAFRDSSDVIRLNDVWYGSREVTEMMRLRARIATISGWPLIDTDTASTTNLKEWWNYVQAQPSIGIPALYFVSLTDSTLESPSDNQWSALAAIWRNYIDSLQPKQ